MKVTKYPQSCLLLEKGKTRIVIDPGSLFSAKYSAEELGKLDGVLYTHQHADHFDPELSKQFIENGVMLYGNESVAQLIGDQATKVFSGKSFELGEFSITPHDLPHCPMIDGSAGPPNTGYIIDGTFFHPGDGIDAQDVQVQDVAAPIAGPSISLHDAYRFVKQVGAERVIPIHYDYFPEDPAKLGADEFEVIVLADGQSTEL